MQPTADGVVRPAGLRDDLVAGVLEQARDAFAQQHRVVGEHHAQPRLVDLPRAAQRRELAGEVLREELVEHLRLVQPRELVGAELARVLRLPVRR